MLFPFKPAEYWESHPTPSRDVGLSEEQENEWKRLAIDFIICVGESLKMYVYNSCFSCQHKYDLSAIERRWRFQCSFDVLVLLYCIKYPFQGHMNP